MTAGPMTAGTAPADSLLELAVPFLDSRAADLCWALDLPVQPAVASRRVVVGRPEQQDGGGVVDLRVLGGSHQVVVRRPGRADVTETVACRLSGATPLPTALHRDGYRLEARTERHGDAALGRVVDALLAELADDPHALLGRFPGHPHAVTALRVDTAGPLSWQTWHAYPQTGELVTTRSTLDDREENP